MLFFNPKAYCSNVECVSVSRTNISEAQACVLQEQERRGTAKYFSKTILLHDGGGVSLSLTGRK